MKSFRKRKTSKKKSSDYLVSLDYDEVLMESERAVLLKMSSFFYKIEVWIPKSVIVDFDEKLPRAGGIVLVPFWFADKKGLCEW